MDAKHPTFLHVSFESGFFQTVGMEPGRITRLDPPKCRLFEKHDGSKWTEQTMKRPVGLKLALCVFTN